MKLRVYVTTSDWYNPLIPAFAYLFNRYWSPDQQVTVLGYTPPDSRLPENFSFVSLRDLGESGPGWSRNPRWTDSLRPFFEELREDRFILLQIDYFLKRAVRHDLLALLERRFDRDGAAKADLTLERQHFPHEPWAEEDGAQLIASRQDAPYRSSLQAAIWRRDYFLELLVPGRTPWQFEKLGMIERMGDGRLILGLAGLERPPVSYLNLYRHGALRWNDKAHRPPPGMLADLLEKGLIGPWWNGWGEGPGVVT